MSESNGSRPERLLADALRREALGERPEFSESLHARLLDAVRGTDCKLQIVSCKLRVEETDDTTSPTDPAHPLHRSHPSHPLADIHPRLSAHRPLPTVLAAAAAVLLAATIAWQWAPHGRLPQPPEDSGLVAAAPQPAAPADAEVDLQQAGDLASQAVEGLDDLVDAALAAQRWAELDEDARAALSALADHLPPDLFSALALSEPPEM